MSTPGQPGQPPGQQGPSPGQGPPAGGSPGPPGHAPGPQGGGPPPPQPPQKKKSSPLPWILGGCGLALVLFIGVVGVGSYFVFIRGDGIGGSDSGPGQGSPTPQAQPKYTGIPFRPCEEIGVAAVSKAVPDAKPRTTESDVDSSRAKRTCVWNTPNSTDIDFSAILKISLTAYLRTDIDTVQSAREETRPRGTGDATRVRRIPNVGDVAYSWKTEYEAVVKFSTSNLLVEVTYSKNKVAALGEEGNYPYEELRRVALTWAKNVEQKL